MGNNDNNMSNKNVTHTQNLPPKTRSNSAKNSATDDYKYIPGANRPSASTTDKRPSSGNIKGL
jgi:hypothetical protein